MGFKVVRQYEITQDEKREDERLESGSRRHSNIHRLEEKTQARRWVIQAGHGVLAVRQRRCFTSCWEVDSREYRELIIAFDKIWQEQFQFSDGNKKTFQGLITRRTGDKKVKAKMIVNLLRNFCSKSRVNTGPELLRKTWFICPLSQHNYYLYFFYCQKSERGCGILNLISSILINVII